MIERKYTGVATNGSDVVANPTLNGSEQALNSIQINGENFKIEGGGSGIATLLADDSYVDDSGELLYYVFDNTNKIIDCSKELVFRFKFKNVIYKVFFDLNKQITGTRTINNEETEINVRDYQDGELVNGITLENSDFCCIILTGRTLDDILGSSNFSLSEVQLIGYKQNELTNSTYLFEN